MNIVVREPPAVGKSKVVCGHCHHKGHRNQSTNPCTLTKCTDYTYCGVKDKHHEYFQKLNAMKLELSKRKAAINDLENQISSMENFKTKSEYHFIKNLSPRLFAIDSSYKTNKAKLMRDIKLLRTALDGRIPEVTANDEEQLQILLKKCKTDLKSEVGARFSSDENMNTDHLNAVTSEVENSKEKTEPVPDQLVRRKEKKRRNKRHKNKHRKRRRKFSSSSNSDTDGHENVRNKITRSPTNSNNIFCDARHYVSGDSSASGAQCNTVSAGQLRLPPYMQLGSNYHAAMPTHFGSNMQTLPYSLLAFHPYSYPFSSNQPAYMLSFPSPPVPNVYSETITRPTTTKLTQPYSNEMVTQLTVPRENDGVETAVEI